jgi:hypothetical protein
MRNFLRLALLCQMSFFTLIATAQTDTTSTSYWRFAHFAPSTPALDVLMDGEGTGLQAVEFSTVSGWQEVEAGSYNIVVVPSGENTALFSLTLVLGAGEWATVVAEGSSDNVSGQILYEDFSPLEDNSARLTLFSSMEREAAVDVMANGETIMENLHAPVNAEQGNTTVEIRAATYDILVTRSGEIDDVLIDVSAVEILPGRTYLVAAVETEDDPRLFVVGTEVSTTETTSEGRALLRVAHFSSGTPSLDVYINNELSSFDDLNFPELSPWTAIPSGTISLAVTLEDEPLENAVIPPTELALAVDSYTTVAIIGTLANGTLEARALLEDYSELAPGYVRVNFLNAHPGLGPVNVQTTEGEVFLDQLGYPGFFGSNTGFNQFIVENGTYDVQVVQSETGETVFDLPATNLFEGRNYFISVIVANPPFVLTFSDVQETQRLLSE